MSRLLDRISIVTGGASGLGLAIAQRLASEGAIVAITDIDEEAGEAAAATHEFTFLPHDVRREDHWERVMTDVTTHHSALHVLVNNAGIIGPLDAATPEITTLEDWNTLFAVNVAGAFLGCRAAIPLMARSGGGSIINMSSVAGLRATPYATAYGATKAAVRHLTKSVAQYCAEERTNIRCNSVHPGDILTPLWRKAAADLATARGTDPDAFIAAARAAIPLGDFQQPEDVAAAVAFLASNDARFITGEALSVDGGVANCESFRASHT
jgi:3(or 17)beta-hydroxysteroid dehydrogenase